MRLHLLLAGALVAGGCANSLHGELDGERVGPARDSVFDEGELDLGALGRLQVLVVAITGMKDACTGVESMEALDGSCTEVCAGMAEVARDHLPSGEMWTAWLYLSTTGEVVGSYGPADWTQSAGFTAILQRSDLVLWDDEEACVAACEGGEDLSLDTFEDADAGEVIVEEWEPGQRLSGSFDLDFGADEVSGGFAATLCDVF